jgi:hypothetical protein
MAYLGKIVPTDRRAGRSWPKIRLPKGLRGRLLLAFAGISSFAVLSAVAGFVAFIVGRQALEQMTATRVPRALEASDLLGHSERLVATGPTLLNTISANKLAAVTATKNAELAAVHHLLDEMRTADDLKPMVRKLEVTIESLAANLDEIGIAASRRDQALVERTALLRNAFGAAHAFARTWSTHFEAIQKQVADLERIFGTKQANTQLNDLEQAMLSMLPLDELQRRTSDIFRILVGAAETHDPGELDRLKQASQTAMRDMDTLVSGVDLDTSTALLPQIKQLMDAAQRPGGLFAVKAMELNATDEGRRLIKDNAKLANRLSDAVRAFVGTSRQLMETSARHAVAVQTSGATALALIALLSLASSVLIVWLYVGRDIVARLTRLGGAMAEIAAGGRDTAVPAAGTDEVAAMGRAVEVFRRNALVLDQLLAERAEAAARLEIIVTERTAELRERTDEVAALNRGLEARVAEQVEELSRVGRLKRFLAPQLAKLIVSQGDEKILESHRREIVVVFCDLRGYTAFTETAEPEEVLEFLREYHGALGPLVAQFEGTLEPCAIPAPKPSSQPCRRQAAINPLAALRIAIAILTARSAGSGHGTGSLKNTNLGSDRFFGALRLHRDRHGLQPRGSALRGSERWTDPGQQPHCRSSRSGREARRSRQPGAEGSSPSGRDIQRRAEQQSL